MKDCKLLVWFSKPALGTGDAAQLIDSLPGKVKSVLKLCELGRVVQEYGRWRQESQEFKVVLSLVVSSRPACATPALISKLTKSKLPVIQRLYRKCP